jgi:rod shape-determining protein MreB
MVYVIGAPLHRLKIAIAVPSGTREVERLAVIESITPARSMYSSRTGSSPPLWGAALAIEESRGRMVVDIGAGVTDVAIISLGNTVYSRATRGAGTKRSSELLHG